eukprot:m.33320 g.33320  ORF g.33320 m.33320 type:complete len:535 (-) comp16796_c0_seq1:28-1632(-)
MENLQVDPKGKFGELAKTFSYGTAGFRELATILPPIMYRVGLLSVLRSKAKKGAAIGIMITASHNPEEDNGVKVVDPFGEMLQESWEKYATQLANAKDADLQAAIESIVASENIDISQPANIIVARDTRPSGEEMLAATKAGVASLQATLHDHGILTTPQLHFIVRCTNDSTYGTPTEEGYHTKLAAAFSKLYDSMQLKEPIELKVDCANGVGAMHFRKLAGLLEGKLKVDIVNDGTSGKLNFECGADFVKTNQAAPETMVYKDGDQCASFDGDADRLMFFSSVDGKFVMLDGDRIAILCGMYLKEKITAAGLALNLGIVQTAYANGGSTAHLQKLGIPTACAKTGVKNLHHVALDYDVGVYFEANGHGTVIFSEAALGTIQSANGKGTPEQNKAITDLLAVIDVINQTVGDAISDLLLVEVILAEKKMNMRAWANLYDDLPNRLLKVKIKDRSVVQVTNAERTCVAPAAIQPAVDAAVAKVNMGRSFVRASGTEDVVRVYAEAETRAMTDQLAAEVCKIVFDFADGIGELPTF